MNAFDFQLNIQKEEAKKKEVHVEENVPAPSPRSNCTVMATLVFVNRITLCFAVYAYPF